MNLNEIRPAVDRCRAVRDKINVFGAEGHGFILGPPYSERDVAEFEQDHGIALPSDYRDFLLRVGSGGAGPYYGVFKLGEMDDGSGWSAWKSGDGFVGQLDVPFPHMEPWNDLSLQPADDLDDEDEYERQLDAFDAVYWSSDQVVGAMPICHIGCALRIWLVVTGPESGNLWRDDRADYNGLYPLSSSDGGRVSFFRWYMDWLEEALRQIP